MVVMKRLVFINVLLIVFLMIGCGKESNPTDNDDLTGTSTVITGTVKDSLGNPIGSAAIKIQYYFTSVAKLNAKTDPCSLVSFTAFRITNGVQLNWTTEGENILLEWEIQRSGSSDTSFSTIGVVDASGPTSSTINYTYVDSSSGADSADYYRLCAVDMYGVHYYYGPVGLGPIPSYKDAFNNARPCPFSLTTSIGYSLACSSQVSLTIKINNAVCRTLVAQTQATGNYLVSWDGKGDNGLPLASGYYISLLNIARHDSSFKFSKPVFINIADSSTARVNAYTDAQGAFTISDIPLDSVFNMRDDMNTDLGNVAVCDSVTVYAVKSGYTVKKVNMILGKNTTSTINFILR
jgi:hypothetical protein